MRKGPDGTVYSEFLAGSDRSTPDLSEQVGDGPQSVSSTDASLPRWRVLTISNTYGSTTAPTPITVGSHPLVRRCASIRAEVRIDVIDPGPGLDPDAALRVFERFYRTDSSRTRARGGTGLGLSIVQALVAAHGGRVTVDTAPGEGATFTVRLPRVVP